MRFEERFAELNVELIPESRDHHFAKFDCAYPGRRADGGLLDTMCKHDAPLPRDTPISAIKHVAAHKQTGKKYLYTWTRYDLGSRIRVRHWIGKLTPARATKLRK
ncbi:MAG: hypothetical protein JRF63_15750 [Deltaproteobacteria bacterium]|nr:hypothetical protein [Deltaproteobacteria bacterium]